jgi:hypothetical protein
MTKKSIQLPEPMHTMQRRYEYIERHEPKQYVKPQYMPAGVVETVARAVADWDLSDPFAYGRTALYARQGYIDVEQTIADYNLRTIARKAAKRREVDLQKIASREEAA